MKKILMLFLLCLISDFCYAKNFSSIESISSEYLGLPYMSSPLGEGNDGKIDSDPLIRYDAFDCQTFVETVLAQYKVGGDNVLENMNKIRYTKSRINFENRNHFFNPDWISNNSYLVNDMTFKIAMDLGIELNKKLTIMDRENWFFKNHNLKVSIDVEEVSIDYISIANLISFYNKLENLISNPMIINIIVFDESLVKKIGTDLDISHTGFLISKGGKLFIRHASSKNKKVIDEEFDVYLKYLNKYPKYIGINFLEIKP